MKTYKKATVITGKIITKTYAASNGPLFELPCYSGPHK